MRIGVPKEIKAQEYRVGLVPGGAYALIQDGHEVFVEAGAGMGSGATDEDYREVGCTVLATAEEVWAAADMIIKVKEPVESEYGLIKRGQIIYTFFHLAAVPELATVLLEKEVAAVAYETIQLPDGSLPLLRPMSEVAGRMSIQVGSRSLERKWGGRGVLLGGVPGVERGNVVILGAGTVGMEATKMAVGMGATVTVFDINLNRLRYYDDIYGSRVQTMYSNPAAIQDAVTGADLVVGAVLVPGARAPRLVTEDYVKQMQPGAVIVDVAVDQGGCIETVRPTTHEAPTFVLHDVVHYCVANMPGAVPRTSTYALTNTTLAHARSIAAVGLEDAVKASQPLALGLNTYKGHITYEVVARDLGLEYRSLESLLS